MCRLASANKHRTEPLKIEYCVTEGKHMNSQRHMLTNAADRKPLTTARRRKGAPQSTDETLSVAAELRAFLKGGRTDTEKGRMLKELLTALFDLTCDKEATEMDAGACVHCEDVIASLRIRDTFILITKLVSQEVREMCCQIQRNGFWPLVLVENLTATNPGMPRQHCAADKDFDIIEMDAFIATILLTRKHALGSELRHLVSRIAEHHIA